MGAREQAQLRDLIARARLRDDPIARIVMNRTGEGPRYREITTTLTKKEAQILTYLSRGLEYEHVADLMEISIWTVKDHAKSARFKLRAKNSAHACCEAIRLGLIR